MNFTNDGKISIYTCMESLSKRLQTLRLKQGLSQKQVADQLGIAASTYRDWEYGKQIKGEPYLDLAGVFQVSLTELMTGNKEKVSAKILEDLREIEHIVESIRKTASSL
ncbi:transcriptional repressor DicA [compost metagenome]